MLKNLTLDTSGNYKCEAMAEGTFQAPFGTGSMLVIGKKRKLVSLPATTQEMKSKSIISF